MKIGVVGLGKLGLPLALVFAKAGFTVIGVDVSRKRLDGILDYKKPQSEPKVNKYLEKYWKNIWCREDYSNIHSCGVVFVVVQTPSLANNIFDTQYVEAAVKAIHKVNKECLIVVSSTVPPKTCDHLTKMHGRIAYNPEFIRQGSIIDDFENPKFVMMGVHKKYYEFGLGKNVKIGVQFDAKVISDIWKKVNPRIKFKLLEPLEAEIAKLALNVSFCKDITFANVVGEFCENMNANSKAVMDVVNLDRRNYQAGLGYGGVCFPRDTKCFQALSPQRGNAFDFIENLENCNLGTIYKYVHEIVHSKGNLAFIGLTYKRGVPILEESQGLGVLKQILWNHERLGLKELNPLVYAYDESLLEVYDQLRLKGVIYCDSLAEVVEDAGIVFFGLPIKAPPKLLKGKRVIDPWGINK